MSEGFEPDVDDMFFTLDSPWPVAVVLRNGGGAGEGICERRTYMPLRTCTFTYDTAHDDMVCGACGCRLDMVAYTAMETAGVFRYCPNCGALVEKEER